MNNHRRAKLYLTALAASLGMLSGCGSKTEAPAPSTDTSPAPAEVAPQEPPPAPSPPPRPSTAPAGPDAAAKINVVQVFFGTDRSYQAGNPVASRFGPARGMLSYGTADISIPPDHRLGNLESPSL
jgi:hypothetical protein